MTPQNILSAYIAVGQHYADLTRHTHYTCSIYSRVSRWLPSDITYMMGSDDIPELGWRIVRLIFSWGFAYWWISTTGGLP